jgi:filamentous hemagglutinin family protein
MLTSQLYSIDYPLEPYNGGDPANRPDLTESSTGISVVDIVNPDGNGVSLNEFDLYNVGPDGIIHNNSMQDGEAALGGWVNKNYNLNNEADSIAVYVPSGNASYINGQTEIFGKTANFVIYNPYLMKINGASYINTSEVRHVAGVPLRYQDGALGAEVKAGGMIVVGDKAIVIPPGQKYQIFADVIINFKKFMGQGDLTMSAGRQEINFKTGESIPIYIDFEDEGGADGIDYKGAIDVQDMQVVNGIVVSTQQLMAGGDLNLESTGDMILKDGLASHGDMQVEAENLYSEGDFITDSSMNIDIKKEWNNNSNLDAWYDIDLTIGEDFLNQGSMDAGHDINIRVGRDWYNTADQIIAMHHNKIEAGRLFYNEGAEFITGGKLDINAGSILNNTGYFLGYGDVLIEADYLRNDGGMISSEQGMLRLDIQNELINNYGNIYSKDNLTITAGYLENIEAEIFSDTYVDIDTTGSLDNINGAILSAGIVDLYAGADLYNTNGRIKANMDILIETKNNFYQYGELTAGRDLWINAHAMINQGTTEAVRYLDITAAAGLLNENGHLKANEDIAINAGDLINNSIIESAGTLNLNVFNLLNDNIITSRGESTISALNDIINYGVFGSKSSLFINADRYFLNNGGGIYSLGDMYLRGGEILRNLCGDIKTLGRITINSENFVNIGEAYTAITKTFKEYGEEIYNIYYAGGYPNQDQTALLDHDGYDWPDPNKDGWNRHGYWGFMDIIFNNEAGLSPLELEKLGYMLFYSDPYRAVFRFNRGAFYGTKEEDDIYLEDTIKPLFESIGWGGGVQSGSDMFIDCTNVENIAGTLMSGGDLTIYGENLNNSQIIYEVQYGHNPPGDGGFEWYSPYKMSFTGNITAKNNLNLSVINVNNSGVMEAGSVNVDAVNINNGIFNEWTLTPDPVVPSQEIDLSDYVNIEDIKQAGSSGYLLQADPAKASVFIDAEGSYPTAQFLFDALGKPNLNIPFLADAIREAELLEIMLKNLTGRLSLFGDVIDIHEQRQLLYENAIKFAQENKDAELGNELTEEQMEEITDPFLWYVKQLINGIEVYVPKLYMPGD